MIKQNVSTPIKLTQTWWWFDSVQNIFFITFNPSNTARDGKENLEKTEQFNLLAVCQPISSPYQFLCLRQNKQGAFNLKIQFLKPHPGNSYKGYNLYRGATAACTFYSR